MISYNEILKKVTPTFALIVTCIPLIVFFVTDAEKTNVLSNDIEDKLENVTPLPSFDCVKATTKAESLICATPELAILDLSMANAYRDVWAEQKNASRKKLLKASQTSWLSEIRDSCVDTKCLKNNYEKRIALLRNSRQ